MTSLAVAVGATTTTWVVDNDDIIAGLNYPVRLVCEDETIEVTGAEYVTFNATERTRWTVNRGVDGTTRAAHVGLTPVTSGAVTTGAGGASPPFAQSDVTDLEADLAAAGGGLKTVTRTLTSPEILALFTTPITLVAGVAGKVYVPVDVAFVYHFNTVAYSATEQTFDVGFYGASGGVLGVPTDTLAWFTGSEDGFAFTNGVAATYPVAVFVPASTGFSGEALEVWDGVANPTLGDGTLDVIVLYREITV